VIDRLLSEARGEQLFPRCAPLLSVEDELNVTLPSHIEGSVTLNLLRLYARP
jgi:hypothetical protein